MPRKPSTPDSHVWSSCRVAIAFFYSRIRAYMRIRTPDVTTRSEKTGHPAKNLFDGKPHTFFQSKTEGDNGSVTLTVSARGKHKLGGLLLYAVDHGIHTPSGVRVSIREKGVRGALKVGQVEDASKGQGLKARVRPFKVVHQCVDLDARTTGLKWVRLAEPIAPSEGIELVHEKLSQALLEKAQRPNGASRSDWRYRVAGWKYGEKKSSKANTDGKAGSSTSVEQIEWATSYVEFTADELSAIGVTNLRNDHFIQIGDYNTPSFFMPAARKRWVTLLSAHEAGEANEVKLELLREPIKTGTGDAEAVTPIVELDDDFDEGEDEGDAHLLTPRTKRQLLAPLRVSLLREGELSVKDLSKVRNAYTMVFSPQL